MADKYVLRVTAGPDYDLARHVEVPVNSPDPVRVTSPHIDVDLNVRVQNYRGLPRGAPATSPYFAHEPHASRDDQYSIALRFTLKDPRRTGRTRGAQKRGGEGRVGPRPPVRQRPRPPHPRQAAPRLRDRPAHRALVDRPGPRRRPLRRPSAPVRARAVVL
ncbi:hypothetical protein VTK73DRAFT_5036 [Phialemonium thermophilum]|uniref:Uncharacterized protein n=1 Tax=Phialemonium thermophilum TaxID=223376 RepID=A0ABR3V486_9PEZI